MRILLFVTASMILCGTAYSQDTIWEQWDQAVIDQANTAKNIAYYSENEKKVVLLMNLARLDGQLFSSTYLSYYIQANKIPKNSYVKSLYRELKIVKGLPVLEPKKDLFEIAKGHATKSGNTGHVGHIDMNQRFAEVFGSVYFHMAENCSYGYEDAMDIVITLLIDDGVKSVGHRKNILNKSFNSTGVSIQPHKDYRSNCVIDFGGDSH